VLAANALPKDVPTLHRMVIERDWEIEHLKLQLAKLRRWKFGASSEAVERAGQIPLTLEKIEAMAQGVLDSATQRSSEASRERRNTAPARRQRLPEHFPRETNRIEPSESTCSDCGGEFKELGKPDEAEVLEVKTVTFTVTRHVRPKKRCCCCARIVQAPAPSRPIERSFAGASVLAMVAMWKYGFHLPLYRQCQMFAHSGFNVSRTTLMQWVAGTADLLAPLAHALARYVLSGSNVNGDDTPFRVLAPGTGKTKRGYLWTYVRDGRPWKSRDPPAVWYQYSPGRAGKYPREHLKTFAGTLQVDGYAGFNKLFRRGAPAASARITEVGCWAHARRGFFDLYEAKKSATAKEALDRIALLYDVEADIRGQAPEVRLAVRQERAVPLLDSLYAWMVRVRTEVQRRSALAKALDYVLKPKRWEALRRYTQDGQLEIDNTSAERSIRGAAVGKKNYLFFGSDAGGQHAAVIYGLIETCKLNHIDPQRYLEYVLERIADHRISDIEELLPWNVADKLNQPEQVSQALAA